MAYPLQLEGFEGRSIAVEPAGFFHGARLIVDNQPAQRGAKRGQFLLRRNDGREVVGQWRLSPFDPVPAMVVDGKTIRALRPLAWYEWAFTGLPLLLVFVGGAIGAVAGIIGLRINVGVFRLSMNTVAKYAVALLISFAAVLVYIVFATMLRKALGT